MICSNFFCDYTGIASSGAFDQAASSSTGSSATPSSGNVTTTAAKELCFGLAWNRTSGAWAAGSGYTMPPTVTAHPATQVPPPLNKYPHGKARQSCYHFDEFPPSLRRAIPARRLSEGSPDEFQTGGARRASRNRTHHFDGKAPGKIHLRPPRFHRAASQERLVDQPNVERRREAAMVRPICHYRNGLSIDRPQTRDRNCRSPHAIDRAARTDAGRSALRTQTHHTPRCTVKEPQRALEPLLIPRSRQRGCLFSRVPDQGDRSAVRAQVMVYALLLFTLFVAAPAPASAADIEHGKILYEQHCTRCHDSRVFTRPDHRIRSLEALKIQVKRCELNVPVNWPQQDVDDVVAYLDASFYKFGGASGEAQK